MSVWCNCNFWLEKFWFVRLLYMSDYHNMPVTLEMLSVLCQLYAYDYLWIYQLLVFAYFFAHYRLSYFVQSSCAVYVEMALYHHVNLVIEWIVLLSAVTTITKNNQLVVYNCLFFVNFYTYTMISINIVDVGLLNTQVYSP